LLPGGFRYSNQMKWGEGGTPENPGSIPGNIPKPLGQFNKGFVWLIRVTSLPVP